MNNIYCLVRRILFFCVISIFSFSLHAELTASEVVNKASKIITSNGGLKSQFELQSGNHRMSGEILLNGDRFILKTPMSQTWFNGKEMWTYNSKSKETVITIPTSQEITETNPLRLLKTNSLDYKAIFARTQPKGKYAVVLVPRKKNIGISRVDITLDAAGCSPELIKVTADNGTVSLVKILKLQSGIKIPLSSFNYPETEFPGVEIVDLR